MSTKIQSVIRDDRWTDQPIKLTQFAGPTQYDGSRLMVQVTARNTDKSLGRIQLSRGEAVRLANRLHEWAAGHATMGDDLDD